MIVGDYSSSEMVSSGSFKQGYLHIKRERGSSAVASRMLFKPWQQAYFILRKDPYILEEYKDASLKTQKQVHFIGTVKHVGPIRTSKSKQYAFEVVVREKTPLLLACDNEILLNEWINAFTEIMQAVDDIQRKNSETLDKLSSLDRHLKAPEKFHIEVIETTLSEANDLHGEYDLLLSTSRILLADPDDGLEVLSWPLSHMTSFRGHANSQRIIFSMGRNCHFGCGKLIFETSGKERIVKFIQSVLPRKSSGGHEPLSNSLSSSSSSGSRHLVDGSFSSIEKNETSFDDKPVFDSPILDQKDIKRNQNSVIVEENNNNEGNVDEQENEINAVQGNTIHFAEITSEDAYILPNEQEIDEKWRITHSHFSRFSTERTRVFARSRQNSDNEVDSSSYLQILEEEETTNSTSFVNVQHRLHKNPSFHGSQNEEEEMQKLLKSVTSSLENPLQNENVLAHLCEQKKSKSTSAVIAEKKIKEEFRRASEPFTKSSDPYKPKLVHTRGVHSQDVNSITEHIKSSTSSNSEFPGIPSVNSPLSHKKVFKTSQDAFPKQRSITNKTFGSESGKSPFSKAESFLTRPLPQSISYQAIQKKSGILSMRRNQTQPALPTTCKSPDLNRNTKPKHGNINSSEFTKAHDFTSAVFNIADSNTPEEPPPVPERISPTNLLHSKLHRTDIKDIDDIHNDKKFNNEMNTDEICSSVSGKTASNSSINRDSPTLKISGGFGSLLAPPPLPPKSKVLSSTRSAPLSGTSDVPNITSAMQNRRSSYGSSTDSHLLASTTPEDKPPEIPNRDHIPLMVKKSHSNSDGNLLSISDTPPPTPPRTPPRKYSPSFGMKKVDSKVLSRSLDSNQLHNLLAVTVTTYEEEELLATRKPRSSTLTDTEINITPLPDLPKGLNNVPKALTFSPKSSNFPKSPKKFF